MPPATIRRPGGGHSQNRPIARGPLVRRSSGRGEAAASVPSFTPADLTPALWIDPSDAATVTISGSSGAYIGPSGLKLPGSAGNYAVSPHVATYSITGDIDLIAYINPTAWTSTQRIVCHADASVTAGFEFLTLSSGKLTVLVGTGSARQMDSPAHGFSAGTARWVRAAYDNTAKTTTFYTSTDPSSTAIGSISWTTIGTSSAHAGGSPTGVTASMLVGIDPDLATSAFGGTISRAIVKNGIGGTTVFDADFESATDYVSALTESALGAPVYVVSSTATSSTANYGYVGPLGLVNSTVSANNYASVPDSAAVSITGDIDIICKATAVDWTPSGYEPAFVAKDSSTQCFAFYLTASTGTLGFYWWNAGGSFNGAVSTVATGVADGATKWVRVTLDVDNGAGGYDLKFWLSDDGTSWTQLGSTVVGGATTSIRDGTDVLSVSGRPSAATAQFLGTISRAIVKNGIGGTTVFDADFTAAADYCTSFTESSSNAATVTITATNTPANAAGACVSQINDKSGNARHLTQGTLANMPKYWNGQNGNNVLVFDGTNDLMRTASAITNSAPFGSLAVVQLGASPGANIYVWDSHTTAADVLMSTLTTTSVRIFAGTNLSAVQAVPGRRDIWAAKFDGASSTLRVNGAQVAAGNAGASVHELLTLGAMANGTANWWKGTVGEVIFWPSPSSFTDVESYASTKWGTP